jgi:lysophospholipase L1-like esterase
MRQTSVKAAVLAVLAVLVAASTCAALGDETPAAPSGFFFKDGDRVVVMGDSITEQHLYSNYLETWVVTRFPTWNIIFRNVGIGGDRSSGGNSRFKRDVLPHKATAMTVDFGMNDGGYGGFNPDSFKSYMAGLQGIADQARSNNIRVAWVTPQPVEKREDGPAIEGYAATLEKFSEGVKAIAATNAGAFADQFHPYLEVMNKARAEKPGNRVMGGDAVHPGPPGQAVMASSILKGLNFPTLVSVAEIDAAKLAVTKAEQCQITDVGNGTNGGIVFSRLDAALPYFPEQARPILKWAPIADEMNQYLLKVTGLKPGKYEIQLGGTKVAEYDDTALAQGVNLAQAALAAGPVADQVKAVVAAVEAKNRFAHDRIFRGITLARTEIPDFVENRTNLLAEIEAQRVPAMAKRSEELPKLDAAVRSALIIKPHRVVIIPLPPAAVEAGQAR